ncbi:unnamed protein product [Dibothriocephalus latus]|uniref:Uncharacterized protein n=1 Tax=Dibothriocephalus latus TaxID=60516 RepID=A0A3P7L2F8_DIBLA|nr:unnamed protein product [Dibothriocephalus latus]
MDIASGDSNEGLSVLLRAVADGRLEEELEKIQRHSPIPGDRYMPSEADFPQSSSIKAQSQLLDADFSRATQVHSSLQHLVSYFGGA